jgi:hypothetical protein
VSAEVGADALCLAGTELPYVDMDSVVVDGHAVTFTQHAGPVVTVTHLARGLDDFLTKLFAARAAVRRGALLQWTGDAAVDSYEMPGDEPATIHLFPDGLTVEPRNGTPTLVPLGLVTDVVREGYTITLHARHLPPVTVRRLGRRTDEFVLDLERARADLAKRTAETYTSLHAGLEGFSAPDGWAVGQAEAGLFWEPLRTAAAGTSRADEVAALEKLSEGALRLGVASGARGQTMPFALASRDGRVAVEAFGSDARATYIFATDDVDKLNVALILTSFRREALYLPEDSLGRWALAARTLEVVRWARDAYVGRVVHDATWRDKVTSLLIG